MVRGKDPGTLEGHPPCLLEKPLSEMDDGDPEQHRGDVQPLLVVRRCGLLDSRADRHFCFADVVTGFPGRGDCIRRFVYSSLSRCAATRFFGFLSARTSPVTSRIREQPRNRWTLASGVTVSPRARIRAMGTPIPTP